MSIVLAFAPAVFAATNPAAPLLTPLGAGTNLSASSQSNTASVIPTQPVPTNILAFDAEASEVKLTNTAQKAHFIFHASNVSSAEVVIKALRPSCGCTVAKMPENPWRIAAGTVAAIEADMSVYGEGTITKSLSVETSAGSKYLVLRAIVPLTPPPAPRRPVTDVLCSTEAERYNNMQIAKTDRQLTLRGTCAECHVQPAAGKMGKELFVAACAICHMSENRNPLVYDLQSRRRPMPVDYWKMFIDNGKPGTLMPSFPQTRSGFLTPAQVTSLIDYLTKAFPKESKMVYQDIVRMERARQVSTNAAPDNTTNTGFAVPQPK